MLVNEQPIVKMIHCVLSIFAKDHQSKEEKSLDIVDLDIDAISMLESHQSTSYKNTFIQHSTSNKYRLLQLKGYREYFFTFVLFTMMCNLALSFSASVTLAKSNDFNWGNMQIMLDLQRNNVLVSCKAVKRRNFYCCAINVLFIASFCCGRALLPAHETVEMCF